MLVSWELPEDNQFPSVVPELPEAAKYALLWVTKDMQRVRDSKIFWILMEMNIRMAINRKPWLSPTVFDNLQGYAEFKVDFHHVAIRARKDPTQKWYDLPSLAMDDTIDVVLDRWPAEWHTTIDLAVGGSKSVAQRKKEEAKLKMTQLAEKRKE